MTNKLKVKNFRYLFKLVFKITKWHVDSISKKKHIIMKKLTTACKNIPTAYDR